MPQPPERPPYESYAAITGAFAALLAGSGALSRALGRDPQCQTALDFAVLGAATFKAARTLSRDRIASFIRDPFVRGDAYLGEDEVPAGTGAQRAIGELVTCTRCVGTWAAAGLTATQILAPRVGRLLTWSLAASAANDFLQAGFVALTREGGRARGGRRGA